MAGDRQEAQVAGRRALAVAVVARAAFAAAAFAVAAAARAAVAMAVVALVAIAVVGAAGPAAAADLAQLPTPTTTLPAVSAPKVTVPPVPAVTTPDITVPPVAGTVTPPKVDLRGPAPSGSPSPAAPAPAPAPAPAAGAVDPGTLARSEPVSSGGSTVTPAGVGGTVGARETVGSAARRADPAAGPLAFRLRRAAAETVKHLTFPLALALSMVAFLVFQHRVDKDDPRVAVPVERGDNDRLGFS